MMELVVPISKTKSIILRNAFKSISELETMRTQWHRLDICMQPLTDYLLTGRMATNYFGVVINTNNLTISQVNSHGIYISTNQLYPRSYSGKKLDLTQTVPEMISYLRSTVLKASNSSEIRIFCLDYDVPVKSKREEIMSYIASAEGRGAIKGEVYSLDPDYEVVCLRNMLQYMKVVKRATDPLTATVDFSRSMWPTENSRVSFSSTNGVNIDEARSYLLSRYAFTFETIKEFMENCHSSFPSTPRSFYLTFIGMYVAHYYRTIGEKYSMLDLKCLPDSLRLDIDNRLNNILFNSICEMQGL